MNNLDRAKLESYIDGLCGGQYTPAGDAFIISADVNPNNLKSAFASTEESITLLPLENKTQSCPFGRFLIEAVEPIKTSEDLKAIAEVLSAMANFNSDINIIDNNKIQLTIFDWNTEIEEDIYYYLKNFHPEVDANFDQNKIEISLK